jgi:AsmA-like C-terminal region
VHAFNFNAGVHLTRDWRAATARARGMLWLRHLTPFAILAAITGGGLGAYHLLNQELDSRLRSKVAEGLARENLRAEIGTISLNPFRGLVAEKFRLYGGPNQRLLVAAFDELRLDIDLSRLLHKEQFINSIELRGATLSLPVDPDDPETEFLALTDVHAQIMASGDRFEIRRARGDLYGIKLSAEGSLLRPSKIAGELTRPPGERRAPLDLLKDRRGFLDQFTRELQRFEYDRSPRPPRLDLRIDGDLDRPQGLHVWARLRGQEFRYDTYAVEDLDLVAEWIRGGLVLRHVRLRDDVGLLQGHARWELGSRDISFTVNSAANLPALIDAIRPSPVLHEFVVYEPGSLKVEGEGRWRLPAADGSGPGELQMVGTVSAGRFATRGRVFDSLSSDFYLAGNDFNLRDLRLEHASGALEGHAMRRAKLWHYRGNMRMNPEALKPFIPGDEIRRVLDRFDFDARSTVELEASGSGPASDPAGWTHDVLVKARGIRLDGEPLREARATVRRANGLTTATDVRLLRPEGEIKASQLVFHDRAATLQIDGLTSAVLPVPVLRWFAPKVAEFVGNFQFDQPPSVQMHGTVGLKTLALNDFTIDLTTKANVRASVAGLHLPLVNPSGRLTATGPQLRADLTARLPAGTAWRDTKLLEPAEARFLGVFPIKPTTPPTANWQLFLTGPSLLEQPVAGHVVPLHLSKASLDFRHQSGESAAPTLQVEATGRIRAGTRFRDFVVTDPAEAGFQGVFDLKARPGFDRTRWSLTFKNPGTTEIAVAGKNLPLQQLAFVADYRRNRLDLHKATARLLGGGLAGSAQIDRLSGSKDYSLAVQADNVSLPALAKIYSPDTTTGGQFSGGFRLTGQDQPGSKPRGAGQVEIKDGDIFALPLLGPLSPLLSSVLPGTKTGYSKARRATTTFSLADGLLTTRDFEATTNAFVLKLDGQVNLENKQVNLQARVNTRGPTGLLLYPVSKLLEFEAPGTTVDPGWRPRVLSLPGRLIPDFRR